MPLPRLAVHKFSSCDGCQLALLNLGPGLLELAQRVEIVHFAEAGPFAAEARVDIALVEGSISTADEVERIRRVRANSRHLVTIGACATSGGLQALRNLNANEPEWRRAIYADPGYISSLAEARPVADLVKVDLELWGCPVNAGQVVAALDALLRGTGPRPTRDPVCMDCKRKHAVCVMVTRGEPCMGPVTRTGCGAICPSMGRACYACYGPTDHPNGAALGQRLAGLGLLPRAIARHFQLVHGNAPAFRAAGVAHWPGGLYPAQDRGND